MIRLSKLTDYAVAILAQLSIAGEGKVASCAVLSAMTGVPEPTVAKILKMLTRAGFVMSTRGIHGGYRLDRPADKLTVADIITAMDGPIAVTACVDGGSNDCMLEAKCPVRGNWDRVNRAVRAALEEVTLADISVPTSCGAPGRVVLSEDMKSA